MIRFPSLLRNDTMIGIGIGSAALAVYLKTLSPSVGYMDSGELAAAQYGLGVAHPTGYPLFTLLGRAFLLLSIEGRVIWRLNLMTAMLAALAVAVVYRLILCLLADDVSARTGRNRVAAGTAAVTLAFSGLVWSQAVALEVYALHLLFLAVVTLLFLRALANPREIRLWILFAYALGLSLGHHLMTALLAPAFLYLHFATFRFGREAWRRIAIAAPPFLLGLTPCLYLPIRATAKPLMNWGDPSAWDAFLRHVSGAQFRFFLFPSVASAVEKLAAILPDLARSFGYAPLLAAPLGIWALGKTRPKLLAFTILLFAAGVAHAVQYGFDDPDFTLNAYLPVTLWIARGISFGIEASAAGTRRRGARPAAAAAGAALCLFPLFLNAREADRSRDYAYEDFARAVLESADSNAIILTRAYGALTSPAYYLQAVEGVRPDVVVVQAGLLMLPWYPAHLDARDPRIVAGSRPEFEALAGAIRNRAPETLLYGLYGRILIESLIRNNRGARAVHATVDMNPQILGGAPWGLMYRFFPDSAAPPPFDDPEPRFRPIGRPDARNLFVRAHYASLIANHGVRRINEGDTLGAIARFRRAAALNPERSALAARLKELETAHSAPSR